MNKVLSLLYYCVFVILFINQGITYADNDPLPSWDQSTAKEAILSFVKKVTEKGSSDFVPEPERIAVFDNDGTLWVEHPMYVQLAFVFDRVKALAPEHPEWKSQQPFKAILEDDFKSLTHLTESEIYQLLMITHAGITTDEFDEIVKKWLSTAKHPKYKVPYTELIYQPMVELMEYLRSNGFKTFIVSGGGVEFMRVFALNAYGIPKWQVVGSSIKLKYEEQGGKHVLMRLPEMNFIDDKAGKPIGIQMHIGFRPIAAFGNSDGDYQMLEWTSEGKGIRLAMIVHHDDAEREYSYDRNTHFGKLDKALDAAKEKGWILISMKDDWKQIWIKSTPNMKEDTQFKDERLKGHPI